MNDEIRFLIQCYFGDIDDPYLAAIDRAYIDMQTHTISGEKNKIFEMRRSLTECLYKQLKSLNGDTDYNKWHEKTSHQMKEESQSCIELSYGQIQKWINMSVKYLYTFRSLGLEEVNEYFVEHKKEFHAPLDSYVLNHLNKKGKLEDTEHTWSQIETYDEYRNIEKHITFEEEYKNWPEYVKQAQLKKDGLAKKADKYSYKRHIQKNYSDKNKPYCGCIRWNTKEIKS